VSSAAQRARWREERESTRQQIIAAADRFLRERPFRELSVEAVMEGTGLTRTAFYRHFDDLTDLVLRVFAAIGLELYTVAERWSSEAGVGYPGPAVAGLAGTVDFFAKHGRVVQAIVDAAATDEQIEHAYRAAREAYIEVAANTLDRLAEQHRIVVPDATAMARALVLMSETYLLDQFGREPLGDRELARATLATVWLRAAAPQAGVP
jgi:TetR/AcrR family transcriptional regulator, ethionamide resistance regulator